MTRAFPGVGHRYFVDFKAFRVELDFASETSLTYYNLNASGKRVGQETVTIAVEPVRDGLYLVTWTESDGTTVVHLEDYRMKREDRHQHHRPKERADALRREHDRDRLRETG